MSKIILDKIDNIEIDSAKCPVDNIHALNYLRDGIFFLANKVREAEKTYLANKIMPIRDCERGLFPPDTEFISSQELIGMDFTGRYNHINCIFQWFSISVVNYIRSVGLIDYLQNNNKELKDITSPEDRKEIKNYCTQYVESVAPEIKKYRDKVAAHFCATDPYSNDNFVDLELSLMSTLTSNNGLFEINGMSLSRDGVKNNQLPTWSITNEFNKLKNRYWPDDNINSKVAVVCGGAMGYKNGGASIGGSIALRLAADGFAVAVIDGGDTGQTTADKIIENNGRAIFIQADVTNTEDIKSGLERIKDELGDITCLVNCVARYSKGIAKNAVDISEDEWGKTIEVNLGGYYKMAKYTIPYILESGGGTIINISSIESQVALNNYAVYSVAKAGVDALTRSLAVDFAPHIRTNSILPGFVKIANSENGRNEVELKEWYDSIAKGYPMGRVCTTDDIANVAAFLASDQSAYINGQSILVDGGRLIHDFHEF
jgi:NAD(P)-dependent dehydrogenase (short-subunit alcohol dehydrogenase family)